MHKTKKIYGILSYYCDYSSMLLVFFPSSCLFPGPPVTQKQVDLQDILVLSDVNFEWDYDFTGWMCRNVP